MNEHVAEWIPRTSISIKITNDMYRVKDTLIFKNCLTLAGHVNHLCPIVTNQFKPF